MERARIIPVVGGVCGRAKILAAGSRFGSLVVVRLVGKDKNNCGIHGCLCICGRELMVRTSGLVSGHNTSCGIGKCHWNWRGGKQNIGSEAWASRRLAVIADNSRRNGYAEPADGVSRVLDLWRMCGGMCACCGMKSNRTLHLDHCHKSGRLRGFICPACNLGIGHAIDNPLRLFSMAAWITSQPQQDTLTAVPR